MYHSLITFGIIEHWDISRWYPHSFISLTAYKLIFRGMETASRPVKWTDARRNGTAKPQGWILVRRYCNWSLPRSSKILHRPCKMKRDRQLILVHPASSMRAASPKNCTITDISIARECILHLHPKRGEANLILSLSSALNPSRCSCSLCYSNTRVDPQFSHSRSDFLYDSFPLGTKVYFLHFCRWRILYEFSASWPCSHWTFHKRSELPINRRYRNSAAHCWYSSMCKLQL